MSDGQSSTTQPSPTPIVPEPAPAPTLAQRIRGDADVEGPRMSFMDHLMELRYRLVVSMIVMILCLALALIYSTEIFRFLRGPFDAATAMTTDNPEFAVFLQSVHLASSKPLATMMMVMWIGFISGLLLGSPVIVYELWSFVAPGLRLRERRAIQPVLATGIFFFIGGAAIAYYLFFPVTMQFVLWLDWCLDIQPIYTVDEYMSLLLTMMVICGAICETPLVVAVLAKLGILGPQHLTRYWRPAIFVAFVLGAAVSPGSDVMSMVLFTGLLLSVYVLSVLMALVFYSKAKSSSEA